MQDLRLHTLSQFIIFLFFSSLVTTPVIANPHHSYKNKVFKIVIDAGHGGKDHGTSGEHLKEKDATLKMAMELSTQLSILDQNIQVIYTRTEDKFLPVHRRVAIANEQHADLFISLHCNSIKNHNPHGIETYVLGINNSQENIDVAKRENEAILFEDDFEMNYEGLDPNSPVGHIVLSAVQNNFMNESIQLAHSIQSGFKNQNILHNRGVKQESFIVLRNATMPAILVEAGFLSNKSDEQKLLNDESRAKIVNSIALGISQYVNNVIANQQTNNLVSSYSQKLKVTKLPTNSAYPNQQEETSEYEDRYNILIASSANGPLPHLSDSKLMNQDIKQLVEDGLHKYFLGHYQTLVEAVSAQTEIRKLGYKGAYVIKQSHVQSTVDIRTQYDGFN